MRISRTVLTATLLAAACGLSGFDKDEIDGLRRAQPAKDRDSYTFDPGTALVDRFVAAPAFVLGYLGKVDGRTYRSLATTPAQRAALVRELDALPTLVKRVFRERLLAAYLVPDFQGNGQIDWVIDGLGEVYLTLVINPAVFSATAAARLDVRDSSAFRNEGGRQVIRYDFGPRDPGALAYVLLHEGVHGVDYVGQITPFTEPLMRKTLSLPFLPTPFTRGVWERYDRPAKNADFALRNRLRFWSSSPTLPPSYALTIYQGLRASPFSSLYASSNWAEDLTELMVCYHFTTRLGLPFKVHVGYAPGNELVYEPAANPRVRARFPQLEMFYRE